VAQVCYHYPAYPVPFYLDELNGGRCAAAFVGKWSPILFPSIATCENIWATDHIGGDFTG
jgi:hypothetical protein